MVQMKLWIGFKEINLMTGGNVTEKNVPRWRLQRIAEELGGEVHYQDVIDNHGKKSKRIIISYTEDD
tara:strand:- start:4874 stop:5074 length:201 start_codon:yes stop_codon:yes gene_type:complete